MPAGVLETIGAPDAADGRTRTVARLLGARMVVQGCADLVIGPWTTRPGAAVEVAHGVSMVLAALRWPEHRRTASVSAAVALGVAVLDLAGTGGRRRQVAPS